MVIIYMVIIISTRVIATEMEMWRLSRGII